jgi:hypothetical protein
MNVEVDEKPPSNNNAKGAEAKRKMKLIDSRIPKEAHKGLVHWTKKTLQPLKEAWGHAHHTQHKQLQPVQLQRDTQKVQWHS